MLAALLVLASGTVGILNTASHAAFRALPPGVRLQQIDGGPNYFGRFGKATRRVPGGAGGRPAPADLSNFDAPSFYPISVFDQTLGYNTGTNTWVPSTLSAYRAEGINGFISLYNGYNRSMMNGIRVRRMWVIDSPLAPSYSNPITGYTWFDEPDGGTAGCQSTPSPVILGARVTCGPDASGNIAAGTVKQITADLHGAKGAGDPTRFVYGNYTGGHVAANAGMSRSEASRYVNAVDVASYDDYIVEGAYEPDHALWRQYDDMMHVRQAARYSHPVWCYIEAGDPETHAQWSGVTVTPAMETAEAWNAVIGGARGITWFDHDFGGTDSGYANSSADLIDPNPVFAALQDAVKAWDVEVERLALILHDPFAMGYVVRTEVTGSGNSMNEMVKYDSRSNDFYVFAAPRFASPQTVTYRMAGGYSGPITVYGERRTVTAADGVFSDAVSGETAVHIYVVPNAGKSRK